MTIREARPADFEVCCSILAAAEVGKRYYPARRNLEDAVKGGMESDTFLVAENADGEVVGFVWYQKTGMFRAFPYLQMIAVREDLHGQGIGGRLLQAWEQKSLSGLGRLRTRVFLLVADFNDRAMQLYRRKGYEPVGQIPGLFRRNICETCMMKVVTREHGEMKGVAADE